MTLFFAVLPILALLFFMVFLERPAYQAALLALFASVLSVVFFWKMDAHWVLASMLKAVLMSAEIIYILIGVIFVISILKKAKAFSFLNRFIFGVTRDIRIQAVLLAYFAVAFFEGIAGFGTPSMIVAPLMVSLGFSPILAVATTLIGDGMSVTFGAAGVPITIGIAQGLHADHIALLGSKYISQISIAASLLHAAIGTFLPFCIIALVSWHYTKSFAKAREIWKFAFAAGLSFSIPYVLIAAFIGPELPTILASLIGGFIVIILERYRVFLPAENKEWIFPDANEEIKSLETSAHKPIFYIKALSPYFVVICFLLLSRLNIFGFGSLLASVKYTLRDLAGSTLSWSFSPFYTPGFYFMLAAITAFIVYKLSLADFVQISKNSARKLLLIFVALAAVLSVVQLIINSGNNFSDLPSMSTYLVNVLSKSGIFWPFFAPMVGMFGAFIAGSSTVSNLMFSSMQFETSTLLGFSPLIALSLQIVGSAVGNMIAIHNILAAAAVVHLKHAEGKVIRYNILPALSYSLIAGLIGFLLVMLLK